MCECFKIGGRFIAEDPECPAHGYAAVREREEAEREERARDDEIESLKATVETLRAEVAALQKIIVDKMQ
jgi:hypothetical protein